MTLRDSVVEAMAQAMWRLDHGVPPLMTWDELDEFAKTAYRNKAETALDAELDVLGKHAEDGHWLASIGDVIDALRAGKGSDE